MAKRNATESRAKKVEYTNQINDLRKELEGQIVTK